MARTPFSSIRQPPPRERLFGSRLLAITLSTGEPWLLCRFRGERLETVNRAGNPAQEPCERTHPAEP